MLCLSLHDVLICIEVLWLLISILQFWPPAVWRWAPPSEEASWEKLFHDLTAGGYPTMAVEDNCVSGNWHLQRRSSTLCVEARVGEEALVENWILAFRSFPGKKLPLGLAPSCHLSALILLSLPALFVSLYPLCLVTYSAWKLPIFRPTGQQEMPKSFLVSFLALANL